MIFSKEYREHYKENIRLGLPVILGQIGHMMTAIVDNAMVGNLGLNEQGVNIGSIQLAASSLANTIFILIYIFGIGLAIGLTPAVGKAFGKKNHGRIASYYKNSKFLYLATGAILMILMFVSSFFFDVLDQPKEVVDYAIPYFQILAISMVPFMYFMTLKQFSEGLSLTLPAMYAGLAGNLINVVLNYGLIYGELGMPRMELLGAGIATTIARSLMGVFLLYILIRNKKVNQYLRAAKRVGFNKQSLVNLVKIGVPIGLQFVLEVSAFVAGTIIMGWIGVFPLAAHQIAISLAALTFLSVTGIATAATIRVSNYIGERRVHMMKDAGYSAYILGTGLMLVTAACFIFLSEEIAMIFTDDIRVIEIASSLLIVAGFFQIVDGAQAVGLGILRGMEDVKIPTLIITVGYWIISIPLSYYFSITMDLGPEGVWYGYLAGLTFAGIFLYVRFERISKKMALQPA